VFGEEREVLDSVCLDRGSSHTWGKDMEHPKDTTTDIYRAPTVYMILGNTLGTQRGSCYSCLQGVYGNDLRKHG
jgi:hypothetical protein